MNKLQVGSFKIGGDEPTFIIAEVGQNHQGDLNIAKKLILAAKECGANCVKFQKTCLREKFNKTALARPYCSVNSWGATYGEHKTFLEFSDEDFYKLQAFAQEVGILLTASAMDVVSLHFLVSMDVPFIKIGSGDANNLILIKAAAMTNIPLVISTGMLDLVGVKAIYEEVSKYHKKFVLLHCVSAYPTPLPQINLNVINLFKTEFPDVPVGYSGHELGNSVTLAAVAMGAKVIERHLTLDKTQKGSDHACSLEFHEFKTLIDNIRDIEIALGHPVKKFQDSEKNCYEKLGKTVVAARPLNEGEILKLDDLKIKVAEPKGVDASLIYSLVGRKIVVDLDVDESITLNCLEN